MNSNVPKEQTSSNPLRIDRMRLENFRCFKELDITFDPKLTVIVAPNGGGKTAVLDAVAITLGHFVGAFDVAKGVDFKSSDVRRIPKPDKEVKESEPQYPLTQKVEGFSDGKSHIWFSGLLGEKGPTTTEHTVHLRQFGTRLQKAVRDVAAGKGPELVLPLVSHYGTGRLWVEIPLTPELSTETSRTAGYIGCLDSASRNKIFVDWFTRLCWAEYQERDNPKAFKEITAMLSAVRNAVDCVLKPTGWHGITISSGKAMSVVAEHPKYGQLSVDWLSDGIRNMIALTADIAHRAVRLNSHLGENAVKETPGIVLIDEVDMHLHPEWQQTVLGSLLEAFPRIQFIVTTHSPQVLTTVRKEHVRILSADGEVELISDDMGTYGAESSRVLNEVFGVHSRPQNVETIHKLRRYLELVEREEAMAQEGKTLRLELEKSLGSHDPDLLMADIRIAQLRALGKS